jgi:CheY-like chemotaxis protein
VEIPAVDYGDIGRRLAQCARRVQPAESPSENDDAMPDIFRIANGPLGAAFENPPNLAAGGVRRSRLSPPAALQLIERLQPPILVLDLALTGGRGVDILKALAGRDVHPYIVIVTGSPTAAIKDRCLALGARYFFDKAFDFDNLESALRALAEEAGAPG